MKEIKNGDLRRRGPIEAAFAEEGYLRFGHDLTE